MCVVVWVCVRARVCGCVLACVCVYACVCFFMSVYVGECVYVGAVCVCVCVFRNGWQGWGREGRGGGGICQKRTVLNCNRNGDVCLASFNDLWPG